MTTDRGDGYGRIRQDQHPGVDESDPGTVFESDEGLGGARGDRGGGTHVAGEQSQAHERVLTVGKKNGILQHEPVNGPPLRSNR